MNIQPLTKRNALTYIVPLCLVSVFLALLIISVANDMYAFVKPSREISISIDTQLTDKEFASLLMKNGVIKNAFAFELYLRSKNKSEQISLLSGEWTLNSSMSYREILLEIF